MAAADEHLAQQFGVSPAVVEGLRKEKLTEGEHWHREPCGRVVILPAGLSILESLLDPKKNQGGGGPPAEAAPESCPQIFALTIARVFPNPIWVRVITPNGSGSDVRVRDNKRLQPRMRIQCTQLDDGRWECRHQGQAVPLKPLATKKAQTDPATE